MATSQRQDGGKTQASFFSLLNVTSSQKGKLAAWPRALTLTQQSQGSGPSAKGFHFPTGIKLATEWVGTIAPFFG